MAKTQMEAVSYDSLPDFLTVTELQAYLQIGVNRAYELSHRKGFPKVAFGNRWRFPKWLVREWMEDQAALGMKSKALKIL